jgi:hypothetical protein
MNNTKQVNLLNIQMIATIIYIGSLILSISLTYNDKMNLINKTAIYTKENARKYSIFNRILIVAITFIYLYINYDNLKNAKKKGSKLEASYLQLTASELVSLASIIVLYVILTNETNYSMISGVANPTL